MKEFEILCPLYLKLFSPYSQVFTLGRDSITSPCNFTPLFLFFHFFQDKSDQSSLSLDNRYFMSVLLEPRSLFLLTEDLYHNYLHGIAERTCDVVTDKVSNLDACQAGLGDTLKRSTRISLTIRNVPKILKFKLNLGR